MSLHGRNRILRLNNCSSSEKLINAKSIQAHGRQVRAFHTFFSMSESENSSLKSPPRSVHRNFADLTAIKASSNCHHWDKGDSAFSHTASRTKPRASFYNQLNPKRNEFSGQAGLSSHLTDTRDGGTDTRDSSSGHDNEYEQNGLFTPPAPSNPIS